LTKISQKTKTFWPARGSGNPNLELTELCHEAQQFLVCIPEKASPLKKNGRSTCKRNFVINHLVFDMNTYPKVLQNKFSNGFIHLHYMMNSCSSAMQSSEQFSQELFIISISTKTYGNKILRSILQN
jgi:hypothetical protein